MFEKELILFLIIGDEVFKKYDGYGNEEGIWFSREVKYEIVKLKK